jgi:Tol biopolymer transport system component
MGANGVNPSQITYTVGTSYTGANGVFAEGDQTIFYNLCTTGTTDCEIYSIAVDNTDQNNLGTLVTNAGLGPVVSPNGQFITFNYGGIAIYDIVNQTLVQVLTSGGGMDHPSW